MITQNKKTFSLSPFSASDEKTFHRVEFFSNEENTQLRLIGVFFEGKKIYLLLNSILSGNIYTGIYHLEQKK